MPKYKSYDSETEQLFSEGLSSESIAEHLSEKYNDKFLSSNIRKRITAMGLRDNTVSTTLENNGMLPENWDAAWIKSRRHQSISETEQYLLRLFVRVTLMQSRKRLSQLTLSLGARFP